MKFEIPDGVSGVTAVDKDGWTATLTGNVLEFKGGPLADHVRNRVRQRRGLGVLSQATDDEWTPAPGNPTYALLEEIDPDRREAFVLTQVLGLSYDEAAIVLDCPIGTIRSRVARARVELADEVRAAEAC